MAEYKLSATLAGHGDDVRGVAYPSSTVVLSAARDGDVRLWKLLSDNPPVFDPTLSSHSDTWKSCVTYLPPSAQYPEGLVISGGKDMVIDVRQPSKLHEENAERLLLGHGNQVCALDVDPAGEFVVSGAWDHDARIWSVGKWECETVLKGHQANVWAVLAYDSETIITGCADTKIRVFNRSGKLLRSFHNGQSPIRALCRLHNHPSGAEFAAADNEGLIYLMKISGQKVAELYGHESFIYSLASLPNGEIASSGEDRTMRIWRGTECIQTITHPAVSIWSVAACAENGDLVTGASDKMVRVFTRSVERVASSETAAQFDDAVKGSTIPQQSVGGGINKQALPGPSFLTSKAGTKDGQTQMIKEQDGSVTAHSWSAAQGSWSLIGTVVDAVGSGGAREKVHYAGKDYDFVFDVDIEDGKPPLKLPYNVTQNPYEAATKFVQKNELPITYLDQVANFIRENTQGATLGEPAPEVAGPDPWGSSDRYRPGDADAPPPARPVIAKTIPLTDYLDIIVGNVAGAQKKITELNDALLSSADDVLALNSGEMSILSKLCKQLASLENRVDEPVDGGLALAIKICITWPYKDRMAGLDLLRMLASSTEAATVYYPETGNIIDILTTASTESSPAAENHVTMAVRGFANIFKSADGINLAISEFEKVQDLILKAISDTKNRNIAIAAATVYINYSVHHFLSKTNSETSLEFEQVLAIIETIGKILRTQTDSEVCYRALVALGTLLSAEGSGEAISAAKDIYEMPAVVSDAAKKASDPRIKRVVGEIQPLLS